MNIKNTIASIVISIVVVATGLGLYHPSPTVINQTNPVVNGTSPESSSPYTTNNGVTEWYYSSVMKTGTTTVCSFPAPTGSTTLQYVSWRITSNSNPNTFAMDVGTSTQLTGTTTSPLLTNVSIPANSTASFGWLAPSFGASLIQTGQFVNVVMGTTTTGGQNAVGYCQAEFTQY